MPKQKSEQKNADEISTGFEMTETELRIDPGVDYEVWSALGAQVQRAAYASMFWLGDWYLFGEKKYGERSAQAVSMRFSPKTLSNAAWICRNIEPSRRRERLPFAIHETVAALPPNVQETILEKAEAEGWTVRDARKAVAEYKGGSVKDDSDPAAHVSHNSVNDEWYTPDYLIDAVRDVMGGIDLDPATTAAQNERICAAKFYTKDDDGLTQPWSGRVFLNSPYSKPLLSHFVEKLLDEFYGDVTEAIVLCNNFTETESGQQLLKHAAAVCFLRGRVKFLSASGEPANAPLQGQMVLYYGSDHADAFVDRFTDLGVAWILNHA